MTQDTTPTSGAADLPDAMHMAELLENPINVVCQKTAAAVLRHQHSEFERLQALAAGQATAAQQGVAYAALPTSSHAGSFLIGTCPLYTADQLRAFADATHTLRASHGQAPAQPDPAYSAACHLATALFKKHFAHLPDFASGQAVWGLCGSTAGVISQIDNMVSGLVQPPTTAFSEDEL